MATRYVIGPSIGVARLGTVPERVLSGARGDRRPTDRLRRRGQRQADGGPAFVARFKDAQGRRQAPSGELSGLSHRRRERAEVTLQDPSVASISWTVHLANKKGAWYEFRSQGEPALGPKNSYGEQSVDRRNEGVKGTAKRRKLIIDPGPRTVTGPNQKVNFDKASVPAGYKFASFPPNPNSAPGCGRSERCGRIPLGA